MTLANTPPTLLNGFVLLIGMLFCLSAGAESEESTGAAAAAPTLNQLLKERGWNTWRDADGSIWFAPVTEANQEPATNRTEVEPPPDAKNPAQRFVDMLQERGWITHREPDGTLWVTPGKTAPAESPKTAGPMKPASGNDSGKASPGTVGIEEGANGEISLPASGDPAPLPEKNSHHPAQEDRLERLGKHLQSLGWGLRSNQEGELLLYPPRLRA